MDFRVGEYTYRQTSKINAKQQMKIIRKISPLLATGFGELAPLLVQLKKDGIGNLAELSLTKLGQIATPVARALAELPDEDSDFIISACLSVVERRKDGEIGWFRVWSPEAGQSMFADINDDFSIMLRVALGVFQETFTGFLPAGLSSLIGASPGVSHSIQ